MRYENAPKLPEEWEDRIDIPFDGLFGESALVKVLQEFVSDPYSEHRPLDIEELTGLTEPTVRTALNDLMQLGVIRKISKDSRRPIYKANHISKRMTALTFLAYAILDDRDDTDIMDTSVMHYCETIRQYANFGFRDAATFEDLGIEDGATISTEIPVTRAERK